MLHSDGATASAAFGQPHTTKHYKRIVPRKDACINRENPNRKMPKHKSLVAGFDPSGTFGGVVPHGFTHGYWTLNQPSPVQPADNAGADSDYIARTLIEFDLDDAGITNGDSIEDATLVLHFYRSKSVDASAGVVLFDIHRFHPGLTGNTGDIGGRSDNKFTENATWWEYDYTGSATMDAAKTWNELVYNGVTGATGNFEDTVNVAGGAAGITSEHGTYRWEVQGLGATGSTAEHLAVGHGPTGWTDYSGGPVGSDQDAYADNIYDLGFTANAHSVIAGTKLEVNMKSAVQDALSNYNNKVRLMIKLRNDEAYDGTAYKAYVAFYSGESEAYVLGGTSKVSALVDAKYTPALHITYLR